MLGDRLYVADANNHQIRVIDLNTKMVSTLQLTGLEKLARRKMDVFSGRTIELPGRKIKAGEGAIAVSLALPQGYKLTKDAPFFIDWKSEAEDVIRFRSESESLDLAGVEFPLEVPITAAAGATTITFDAVVYFCKDGSDVCLFDNVRVIVPLEVGENGPAEAAVTISVVAQS